MAADPQNPPERVSHQVLLIVDEDIRLIYADDPAISVVLVDMAALRAGLPPGDCWEDVTICGSLSDAVVDHSLPQEIQRALLGDALKYVVLTKYDVAVIIGKLEEKYGMSTEQFRRAAENSDVVECLAKVDDYNARKDVIRWLNYADQMDRYEQE